ncbi:LPS-assembly protein LptD [Sulfurimonas sp.]|uniref:LPS-assembly protein LptD n=1 Tax=Sulfurimonas sp. TaxID=2022749 RepID=UPI003562FADB
MFRTLFLLLIFYTLASSSEKVEIFATNIHSKDEILYAEGEVNVVYKDYYISAKRAEYDKQSGILELFENIRVTQGTSYKILGEYARINLQDKQREFKPFYMVENQSEVWMSAKDAKADELYIDVESGILSGCNPNKPLWKMEFTSSDYNQETMWLNTYNNRLYIYDILVLYIPYFGYSLDRTRRTGLLYPSLGLSSDEGFYYEQPIYIAEQNWWDLELKPQIRTNRGSGLYTDFRFVDSKVSEGSLTLGAFKEQKKYYENNYLANQKHYGFDFDYVNYDFLNQLFGVKLEGQSEIYMDIQHMNDVDYINLSTNDTTGNATSQQILSRINMFYNNEKNYYGSYIKYYKYLNKEHNSDTLQQLPTLHYHHYLETLLDEHFMYNIDVKSTNIYREEGIGVVQTDVNIPLTVQTSVFDEYLNLSFQTFLYGQFSNFTGRDELDNPQDYDNGFYAKNYSVLQADTSLTKAFTDYTHVVSLGAKYTFRGEKKDDGYYEDYRETCENNSSGTCEFYNVSDTNKDFQIEFSQYLYDKTGSQILYHKLSQNIIYNNKAGEKNEEYGELENELSYQITEGLNFYNNTFYNHDEDDLSKIYNRLTYKGYGFTTSLAYLYKNNFHKYGETNSGEPYSKYLTSRVSYKYDEHYSYKIVYNYDLQTNLKKNLEVGFLYKKRCWDFGLRYVENNRPILSNSGDEYNSIYDRYVYFTILLKPFMESRGNSGLSYKLPEIYKGN